MAKAAIANRRIMGSLLFAVYRTLKIVRDPWAAILPEYAPEMRTFRVDPYRPEWVRDFEEERARLIRVFPEWAVVEHIGSISVPRMVAKPIIDICVGLSALAEAEARIRSLEAIGYEYVPQYEDEIPDRRYFRRPSVPPRTHHLHCVVRGGPIWNNHLLFRNYLRSHADAAAEYAALKQRLAVEHAGDRPAYTEAKGPFIVGVLKKAAAGAHLPWNHTS